MGDPRYGNGVALGHGGDAHVRCGHERLCGEEGEGVLVRDIPWRGWHRQPRMRATARLGQRGDVASRIPPGAGALCPDRCVWGRVREALGVTWGKHLGSGE